MRNGQVIRLMQWEKGKGKQMGVEMLGIGERMREPGGRSQGEETKDGTGRVTLTKGIGYQGKEEGERQGPGGKEEKVIKERAHSGTVVGRRFSRDIAKSAG